MMCNNLIRAWSAGLFHLLKYFFYDNYVVACRTVSYFFRKLLGLGGSLLRTAYSQSRTDLGLPWIFTVNHDDFEET